MKKTIVTILLMFPFSISHQIIHGIPTQEKKEKTKTLSRFRKIGYQLSALRQRTNTFLKNNTELLIFTSALVIGIAAGCLAYAYLPDSCCCSESHPYLLDRIRVGALEQIDCNECEWDADQELYRCPGSHELITLAARQFPDGLCHLVKILEPDPEPGWGQLCINNICRVYLGSHEITR